jgi:hypothetical protein
VCELFETHPQSPQVTLPVPPQRGQGSSGVGSLKAGTPRCVCTGTVTRRGSILMGATRSSIGRSSGEKSAVDGPRLDGRRGLRFRAMCSERKICSRPVGPGHLSHDATRGVIL